MSQCSGMTCSERLSCGGRKCWAWASSFCPSARNTGVSPWDSPTRDGHTVQCHVPCPQLLPIPRGSAQAPRFLLNCTKNSGISSQPSTFTPLFLWQSLSVDNSSFLSNFGCFYVPCTLKQAPVIISRRKWVTSSYFSWENKTMASAREFRRKRSCWSLAAARGYWLPWWSQHVMLCAECIEYPMAFGNQRPEIEF